MSMLEVVDQVGPGAACQSRACTRCWSVPSPRWRSGTRRWCAPAFFLKVLALEGSAPVLDVCVSCGRNGHRPAWSPSTSWRAACCAGAAVADARCRPGAVSVAPHAGGWPGRGVGRAPFTAHRRGGSVGHRGHGDPPRPAAPALRAGPVAWARPPPFGVYVHVPFCRFRCDYCAFATYTDRDHLMAAYAAACVTEIGRARAPANCSRGHVGLLRGRYPVPAPGRTLVAILDAIPAGRGRRGDRGVQSRGRSAEPVWPPTGAEG